MGGAKNPANKPFSGFPPELVYLQTDSKFDPLSQIPTHRLSDRQFPHIHLSFSHISLNEIILSTTYPHFPISPKSHTFLIFFSNPSKSYPHTQTFVLFLHYNNENFSHLSTL